jgi:hypothetical protein
MEGNVPRGFLSALEAQHGVRLSQLRVRLEALGHHNLGTENGLIQALLIATGQRTPHHFMQRDYSPDMANADRGLFNEYFQQFIQNPDGITQPHRTPNGQIHGSTMNPRDAALPGAEDHPRTGHVPARGHTFG